MQSGDLLRTGIFAISDATTSSKLGVQFLGLGYHYPSAERNYRSTQFGAVGYIITFYSSKKLRKKLGGPDPPVVAPMFAVLTVYTRV